MKYYITETFNRSVIELDAHFYTKMYSLFSGLMNKWIRMFGKFSIISNVSVFLFSYIIFLQYYTS